MNTPLSNFKLALGTAKVLRVLHEQCGAFKENEKLKPEWAYHFKHNLSQIAYFSEQEPGKYRDICTLETACHFCKFSESAWAAVQGRPGTYKLRESHSPVHAEHVVPISLVRSLALRMVRAGESDEQVAHLLIALIEIVFLTKAEKLHLDGSKRKGCAGMKTSMPDGWDDNASGGNWLEADRYARLTANGILIAADTAFNHLRQR